MTERRAPAGSLSYIAAPLRALAMPVADIRPDTNNARTHDKQNVAAIAASLKRFGQLKPIVVNKHGNEIEAGNGTYLAAKQLGWTHLAAVVVEHDAARASGYKIADNRTAEMAGWDFEVLDSLLREIEASDRGLYDDLLLDELRTKELTEEPAEAKDTPDVYQVLVDCPNERQQNKLLKRLQNEGFSCKLVNNAKLITMKRS